VATKLYTFFISETTAPDAAFIDQLASVYLQNGTAIKPVLERLFLSPQFQDPSVVLTRYSWPVEFVVRAIKEAGWLGFTTGSTLSPLVNMGQHLFDPPDVAGWNLGQAWFSSGAMLARMNFGAALAENQKFNLARSAAVARNSPRDLLDYLLTRLTADLEPDVYSDLLNYAGSGLAWNGSDSQLQVKAPGLVHLILGSADYQVV
jgi:uncharacterized protein (DUF1800 family)